MCVARPPSLIGPDGRLPGTQMWQVVVVVLIYLPRGRFLAAVVLFLAEADSWGDWF
jgi:hypothetical protein